MAGFSQFQLQWWWAFALLLLTSICARAEVDPITIKGSHFFYKSNGSEFFLRGITYQSFGMGSAGSTQVVDPLADGPTCSRDIPYFRKLNINVLRTYYLDPTRDHSACMNSLADAGIYVLTGLSSPTQSVLDYGWNTAMYAQYTGVVDSLATYSNVLAFSVAFGEATGLLSEYLPFYKAAIRDVKDYMKKKKYREIPIGWEAYFTDTETVTTDTPDFKDLQYMACDTSKADFLGIVPGFLGDDNCTSSKDIADDAKLYSNTSLPVFITQHGCAGTQSGKDNRTYDYVPSLYNGSASQVLSGGIMIDYFKDNSDMPFGVVTVDGTFDINPLPGYTALSKVMATLKPSSTNAAEYTSTNSAPACPTSNAASPYNASVTLPAVPYAPLCDCLLDTLQCVTSGTTVDNYNSTQFIDGLQAVCEGDYDKNCPGVGVDPAKGKYGYFRSCNNSVAWSWAASQYWKRKGNDGACNLNNTVKLRDARPAPNAQCSFLLNQVGTNGDGALTATLAPSATNLSTSSSSKSGLSTGAKAGIGLGVLVFVAAILAGILLVLRHKKRAQKEQGADARSTEAQGVGLLPMEQEYKYQNQVSELPEESQLAAEAPAAPVKYRSMNVEPVEMPDYSHPAELGDGSRPGSGTQGHR